MTGAGLIDGQHLVESFMGFFPAATGKPTGAGGSGWDSSRSGPLAPAELPEDVAKVINARHNELSSALDCGLFEALWAGEWEKASEIQRSRGRKEYPSQSEADLALLGQLYRLLGNDANKADAAFRASGLYREKYDRVAPGMMALVMDGGAASDSGDEDRTQPAPDERPRLPLADGLIQFSDAPPPARDFVLADLILAAKVCLLAGFGGVSKTQWMIQAAVCIALGLPFMGKKTTAGAVLLILGEEDGEEVARRFNAVARWMKLSREQIALAQQRVRAFPMAGLDARLTKVVGGSLESSGFAGHIIAAAAELEEAAGLPVRLVGLDHAGLIHGGEFNAREDVVQTMRQVAHIGQETGAAVLILAHSPKGAKNEEKASAMDVAGSMAWTDLARAVLVLRTMDGENGKRYGIDPTHRERYASLTVVKHNYAPTGGVSWLHRATVEGYGVGVLEHVEMQEPVKVPAGANPGIRRQITALVQEKPYLTKNALEGHAGKTDGRIRASKGEVGTEVSAMLADGVLTLRQPSEEERAQHGIRGRVAGFLTVRESPHTHPTAGGAN